MTDRLESLERHLDELLAGPRRLMRSLWKHTKGNDVMTIQKSEVQIRQQIIDNIAALVERREADRKKRRLRRGDDVTEAIKQIAILIAQEKL